MTDEGLGIVRRCPTHGLVEVGKFSAPDPGHEDRCPVPTYHSDECDEPLGARLRVIGLEAVDTGDVQRARA